MYIDWLLVNKINFILKLKKAKSIMLLAFGFWLLPLFCFSQVNFVPNPSFEQLDSCSTDFQNDFIWPYIPLKLASPWDTLRMGGGGGGDPIICNSCFNPNQKSGVPKNFNGNSFQQPKTGEGYLYLAYFMKSGPTNSWRNYAQSPLSQTLTMGKEYCVTYYASFSNRWITAIDELSAYLDDGSIASVAPRLEALATPQIKSATGVYMLDTLGWMKVQGTFIATGNESYITIGNFRSYAATNYTVLTGPGGACEYYIDDVSVIELDLSASAGPDKSIFLGDSAYIGRPPEIGLECAWYNGTVAIGTGAGIWVKPTATTTYVVQQDICGVIKTDTVTVTVQYVGIDELNKIYLQSKLYPNPNSGEFNIEITGKQKGSAEVSILDVTGKTVYVKIITETVNVKPELENGIYMVKVKLLDGTMEVHRLVISK
jgi:hypothetical protein